MDTLKNLISSLACVKGETLLELTTLKSTSNDHLEALDVTIPYESEKDSTWKQICAQNKQIDAYFWK